MPYVKPNTTSDAATQTTPNDTTPTAGTSNDDLFSWKGRKEIEILEEIQYDQKRKYPFGKPINDLYLYIIQWVGV